MDRINVEVLNAEQAVVEPVVAPFTQLSELALAFVGGGIGDTVL